MRAPCPRLGEGQLRGPPATQRCCGGPGGGEGGAGFLAKPLAAGWLESFQVLQRFDAREPLGPLN